MSADITEIRRDSDVMPKGRLVTVELTIRLSNAASLAEIDEWARYEIGQSGGCSMSNPLIAGGIDLWGEILLSDTGCSGFEERGEPYMGEDGRKYTPVHRYARQD